MQDHINPMPCIVCKKELHAVVEEDFAPTVNQPYGGTTFTSHGHYGSTVFDPIGDPEHIEINICDSCLVKASEANQVITVKASCSYSYWTPGRNN